MWNQIYRFRRNKTLKYGVPMLLLVVGGSFGLREFTQIRYDAQKLKKKMDPALEARVNTHSHSLEEQYQKLQNVDLDSWKNIRGPRPWENSQEVQERQRVQLTKDT